MTWPKLEWVAFCSLVEQSYAGEFDDAARRAWALLLDDVAPIDAISALKLDLRDGNEFRSVGRLIATVERVRGGAPTFDQAWPMMLRALRSSSVTGVNNAGAPVFDDTKTLEQITAVAGPVAAGWCATYGLSRLRSEPVDDPQYSGAVLRRLGVSYAEMTEHVQDRDRLALAGPRGGELRRFEPPNLLGEAS